MRFVPRLYNKEQLRLEESFETAVRIIEGNCVTVASQSELDHESRGQCWDPSPDNNWRRQRNKETYYVL
jgi:hypothetical protein